MIQEQLKNLKEKKSPLVYKDKIFANKKEVMRQQNTITA